MVGDMPEFAELAVSKTQLTRGFTPTVTSPARHGEEILSEYPKAIRTKIERLVRCPDAGYWTLQARRTMPAARFSGWIRVPTSAPSSNEVPFAGLYELLRRSVI